MQVSGFLLNNIKTFFKEKYPSKLDEFYNSLKPETREVMQGAVLSNKWYEMEVFHDCLDNFKTVFPNSDKLKDLGVYMGDLQLKGIFGFIVKFMKPERIFNSVQKSWDRVFSQGSVKHEFEDKLLKLEISDFKFTDNHIQSYMYYIRQIAFLLTRSKPEARYERVDKTTTSFEFVFSRDVKV
jgi:hypothetical protein